MRKAVGCRQATVAELCASASLRANSARSQAWQSAGFEGREIGRLNGTSTKEFGELLGSPD